MMEKKGYLYDVNEHEFDEKVIKASHTALIIVDFWAEWCAPCKMLGPVLERVVLSFGGKVNLAKVNIDVNQELSMRFSIKSIPAVKIFKDGSVVEEFIGALPENDVFAIVQSIVNYEYDEKLARAVQLAGKGHTRKAESLYTSILEENPDHPGARVGLAHLAIKTGQKERARTLLAAVDELEKEYGEAQALLSLLDFMDICESSGGLEKNKKHVRQNPEDLTMHYMLGCCYVAHTLYREAFETFLYIIKKDKHFGDGKAKEAVITLFTLAGKESDLTREYRDRLARELF